MVASVHNNDGIAALSRLTERRLNIALNGLLCNFYGRMHLDKMGIHNNRLELLPDSPRNSLSVDGLGSEVRQPKTSERLPPTQS